MLSRVKVTLSTRDLPFTSPLVKHLLERGKNAIKKHDLELSNLFEEKINSLIRENQMRAVRQESNNHITGSKKWWDTVNRITSRTKLNISLSTQLDSSDINAHFKKQTLIVIINLRTSVKFQKVREFYLYLLIWSDSF